MQIPYDNPNYNGHDNMHPFMGSGPPNEMPSLMSEYYLVLYNLARLYGGTFHAIAQIRYDISTRSRNARLLSLYTHVIS